ncbi:MAG: hypothetical protein JWQ83_1794 [Lacunisphaera sp.]|nr:hypothetical protein [Lacunisphaera sp.]MDB6166654.1 hypothetical protein [Lacunisphaera sp.]
MIETAPTAARWLITVATLAYGVGPFITDMNRTHLSHPGWIGHARFHLMWSAISQLAIAGVALWLVWTPGPDAAARCRLAAILGLGMTSGFWGALFFRKNFHGTLHDPQGIPPLWGKVDGNLVAVAAITGLLGAGLCLGH